MLFIIVQSPKILLFACSQVEIFNYLVNAKLVHVLKKIITESSPRSGVLLVLVLQLSHLSSLSTPPLSLSPWAGDACLLGTARRSLRLVCWFEAFRYRLVVRLFFWCCSTYQRKNKLQFIFAKEAHERKKKTKNRDVVEKNKILGENNHFGMR